MVTRRSLGLLAIGATGAALLGREAVGDALADQPCATPPTPKPALTLLWGVYTAHSLGSDVWADRYAKNHSRDRANIFSMLVTFVNEGTVGFRSSSVPDVYLLTPHGEVFLPVVVDPYTTVWNPNLNGHVSLIYETHGLVLENGTPTVQCFISTTTEGPGVPIA